MEKENLKEHSDVDEWPDEGYRSPTGRVQSTFCAFAIS